MAREEMWNAWKNDNCPAFKVADGPERKLVRRKRPIGDDIREHLAKGLFPKKLNGVLLSVHSATWMSAAASHVRFRTTEEFPFFRTNLNGQSGTHPAVQHLPRQLGGLQRRTKELCSFNGRLLRRGHRPSRPRCLH